MTIVDEGLPDPYGPPGAEWGRPERVEDGLEREPRYGRPRVWVPDGKYQRYYSRPSSWGKKADDTTKLAEWQTRTAVSGFLDFGDQSKTLRMQWAGTGSDDKEKRNELCDKARHLVDESDKRGTAFHAITERHDLGMTVNPPEEYVADLEAYIQIMKHFEIVSMPSGRPGVEVFVAFDHVDVHGKPVRLAGTFDRMLRHDPCFICGRRNRIGDLKTGSIQWGKQTMAVQLGVYANAKEYIPWPDGKGADRFDLPDVCPHKGFIINVRPESGEAEIHWLDIAWGFNQAVTLIPEINDFRRHKNVMLPWTPVPSMWRLVDECTTTDQLRALWTRYPGAPWDANDGALTKYAMKKAEELTG